jgi:hypothetical protein
VQLLQVDEDRLVDELGIELLRGVQHDLGPGDDPEQVADCGIFVHRAGIPTPTETCTSNFAPSRSNIPAHMSPRDERAIRNEALFREVNVHIADLEARVHATGEMLPLVCECVRTGCSVPLEVEPSVFNRVREHPLRFLIAPGHEQLEVESVVERHVGYLIVEKHRE